ncbi:MAG TPA: hypothetical protein VJ779_09165 [Acetobacteraceae bacterium]|nr:hypothetical protein [Acetobacteraceae bacterium]
MRETHFIPFSPNPPWCGHDRFPKVGIPKTPSPARPRDRSPWRTRGVMLFTLAFFSLAAACGAGLGRLPLFYP